MMIIAEEHDRLIDTLLWEVLGGQTPPDLTEKILAKAFPKRSRILRWTTPAVAAAVLIGLALAGWMIIHAYPKPQATGNYIVEGGGEGGYCSVEIEPHSTLRIAGKKKAEEIVLEQGGVTCEVDPSEGSFSVRTEVGTVSVTGTTFTVRMGTGLAAAILGLFLILYAAVLLTRFLSSPKEYGPFYATLAQSLLPVLAGAVILIGVVTQPYLTRQEIVLLQNDHLLPFPGLEEGPFVYAETKLVRKLQKEVQAIAAEIETERASHTQ